MSNDRNTETLESLKSEIKAIQSKCVNICNVIENAPPEFPPDVAINEDILKHKTNSYVKGLESAVHNSNVLITTDVNLLTSQFLTEMKQKIKQMDELSAFTQGCIRSTDTEINRLKNLIDTAKEAQSKPKIQNNEILPEHVQKAKERFRIMKTEVDGLLQSLFPHDYDNIMSFLGELMASKLEESSDYTPITRENFEIVNLLRDMNIVSVNPYNNAEVKLNY